MPPHLDFFPAADLLTSLALTAEDIRQEKYCGFTIVARLKPGVALTQAQQEVAMVVRIGL